MNLPGHWDPTSGITGGQASPLEADLAIAPEQNLPLAVSAATDEDTYTRYDLEPRRVADDVIYHWSISGGGSFAEADTSHSPTVTYKAPALAAFAQEETEKAVTVTCWIDDAWSEANDGVDEPETGSRNDGPLDGQSFTFKVKRELGGHRQHKSWVESTLSWRTNADGDPEPVQPDMAQETLEWTGTPAKPDRVVGVPYSQKQDEAVQDSGGTWKRRAVYVAYSTVGGPATAELTGEPVLPRHWDVPDSLEGGTLSVHATGIAPLPDPAAAGAGQTTVVSIPVGGSVALSVTGQSDSDACWYWHVPSAQADDTVSIHWTVRQGNDPAQEVSGTSPTWNTGTPGQYTLVGTVDDASSGTSTGIAAGELGNRNDAEVQHTVVVNVVPRHWEANPEIGQKPLFNGDGSPKLVDGVQQYQETGRMLAPQDQRSATAAGYLPSTVYARPGQKVGLQVEEASDYDHWTQDLGPTPTGQESLSGQEPWQGYAEDAVEYQWSVKGPDDTEFSPIASAGKAVAEWTAPTGTGVEGVYTLKCSINDQWDGEATGTTPPGETGTRNDGALERTVQVEVRDSASYAEFKVFTQERGLNGLDGPGSPNDEKYDLIGGTAWLMLYLHVGANEQVDPDIISVTMRIEDTYEAHIGQTDPLPYSDGILSFAPDAAKVTWQVYTERDEEGNPVAEEERWKPVESPRGTATTDRVFRAKLEWNTTQKPLGHNGWHSIRIINVADDDPNTADAEETEVRFSDVNNNVTRCGPGITTANVGNLVITDAQTSTGNFDYVRYVPPTQSEGRTPVTDDNSAPIDTYIRFKIEDKTFSAGDKYYWNLNLVDLEPNSINEAERDGWIENPADELAIQLSSFNPALPRGIYGFDFTVSKKPHNSETLLEPQYLRSQDLVFDTMTIEQPGASSGGAQLRSSNLVIGNLPSELATSVSESDSGLLLNHLVKCIDLNQTLEQRNKPAKSIDLNALSPNMRDLITKSVSPAVGVDQTNVIPPDNMNDGGKGHVILTGVDKSVDPNHKNKRMVPRMKAVANYRVIVLNGPFAGYVVGGVKIDFGS